MAFGLLVRVVGEVRMSWNDADYFRRRAEAERALAATSNNSLVAEVHLELAKRYEQLVLEEDRPSLGIVSSRDLRSGPRPPRNLERAAPSRSTPAQSA